MKNLKAITLAGIAAIFLGLGSYVILDQFALANSGDPECYSCFGDDSRCTDLFYGDAVVYPCPEEQQ